MIRNMSNCQDEVGVIGQRQIYIIRGYMDCNNKVRKKAKVRNRYNQVSHLTQDIV